MRVGIGIVILKQNYVVFWSVITLILQFMVENTSIINYYTISQKSNNE